MRSVFGKAAVLAVAASLAGVAVVGCSSETTSGKDEALGTIGMKLRVGPGINIPNVSLYVYAGNVPAGGTPSAANLLPEYDPRIIATPGGGSDLNFALSLPPGQYYVELKGSSESPHPVDCLGYANITVTANQSATTTITLVCDDRIQNGTNRFDVTVESHVCPLEVEFVSASPKNVRMGIGEIATVSATVQDDVVGTPFTYEWTSTGVGVFAPPQGSVSANPGVIDGTYTCTNPGEAIVLTLTATRPGDVDGPGCSDELSVIINCVSNQCGDGDPTDPGETCDDGNDDDNDSCPNDCNITCHNGDLEFGEECEHPSASENNPACDPVTCQDLPVCGDGTVNQASEACDAGAGNSNAPNAPSGCRTNCQPLRCGDTIVDSGEQCDDGNTNNADACSNTCQIPVLPVVCGNGVVQPPTEACEYNPAAPGGVPFSLANCSDDNCAPIESAACLALPQMAPAGQCGFYNCDTMTGNAASGPATGQPKANLCRALLDCVYDTNCAASGDVSSCYCGTGDCPAGGANGPCLAEVQAAAESTSYSDISARFGLATYAVGSALQRVNCVISTDATIPCSVN